MGAFIFSYSQGILMSNIINGSKFMNGKAYFFCDVEDFTQLEDKTFYAQQKNFERQKYKVIDTISLNDDHFAQFKREICQPVNFLQDITSKLLFSENCEYLCLAVTNEHSDATILVCSFQYSYPKFVAVVRRSSYGKKIH